VASNTSTNPMKQSYPSEANGCSAIQVTLNYMDGGMMKPK